MVTAEMIIYIHIYQNKLFSCSQTWIYASYYINWCSGDGVWKRVFHLRFAKDSDRASTVQEQKKQPKYCVTEPPYMYMDPKLQRFPYMRQYQTS
jgi:hypothetical protein